MTNVIPLFYPLLTPPVLPRVNVPSICPASTPFFQCVCCLCLATTKNMERLSANSFEFLEIVGNGAFGRVVRSRKKDNNEVFAIKIVEKRLLMREGKVKQAQTEKNVLAKLKGHPGMIRLHYTFQDEINLYFVLEFCPGGDLASLIHRFGTSFPYPLAVFYAGEIVSVLEYLHVHGVVHRDLKPENLLLTASHHLRLTDFGTALDLQDRPSKADPNSAFVGTAEYVSPEVIRGEHATFSSDLWALGCIVYHMVTGRPPFKAANEYLIFEQIRALDVHYPEDLPSPALDLIRRLLVSDPLSRLGVSPETAQPDYDSLRVHPFFSGLSLSEVYSLPVPSSIPQYTPESLVDGDHDLEIQLLNKPGLAPSTGQATLILSDLVKKKAGWIYKVRRLIITNEPKIRYYDPTTEEQKGEIEVVKELEVMVKSKREFHFVLPRRTYYFKDLGYNSGRWKEAVEVAKGLLGVSNT